MELRFALPTINVKRIVGEPFQQLLYLPVEVISRTLYISYIVGTYSFTQEQIFLLQYQQNQCNTKPDD